MTDARGFSGEGARTHSTLLARIHAREVGAWDRFVRLYGPLIYRWCRLAGLQAADAADVGQEVFQAVVGAIGRFRHNEPSDTLRGWLRTITRNKIRDLARKRNKSIGSVRGGSDALTQLYQAPDPDAVDPLAVSNDDVSRGDDQLILLRQAVELVLGEFKEVTRQALLRTVVAGQDPADVARDLGITPNAVYLARSRIRRRLREEFAGVIDL